MNLIYTAIYTLGAQPRTAEWILGNAARSFSEFVIEYTTTRGVLTRSNLAVFLKVYRNKKRIDQMRIAG